MVLYSHPHLVALLVALPIFLGVSEHPDCHDDVYQEGQGKCCEQYHFKPLLPLVIRLFIHAYVRGRRHEEYAPLVQIVYEGVEDECQLEAVEGIRYAIGEVRIEEPCEGRHRPDDAPDDEDQHEGERKGDGDDREQHRQVRQLNQVVHLPNEDEGVPD